MAGNYPDIPSWRMAYDRDGTQVFTQPWSGGTIAQMSAASIANMNDENKSPLVVSNDVAVIFMFPELRDIDALFLHFGRDYLYKPLLVSSNTTNGVDGTWTQLLSDVQVQSKSANEGHQQPPSSRTKVFSITALGVRSLKVGSTGGAGGGLSLVHIFGKPAPGENLHRLQLVKAGLDERVDPAFFDWGDVARGSSAEKVFRVKNLSPSKTASSIRVAMDVLTDTNPSLLGQHQLSYNGGSFLAEVNIGDLGPGAISGPITLRRVIPTNAVLWLWAFRVFAEATTWTG